MVEVSTGWCQKAASPYCTRCKLDETWTHKTISNGNNGPKPDKMVSQSLSFWESDYSIVEYDDFILLFVDIRYMLITIEFFDWRILVALIRVRWCQFNLSDSPVLTRRLLYVLGHPGCNLWPHAENPTCHGWTSCTGGDGTYIFDMFE